jgi:hypothetical protein
LILVNTLSPREISEPENNQLRLLIEEAGAGAPTLAIEIAGVESFDLIPIESSD